MSLLRKYLLLCLSSESQNDRIHTPSWKGPVKVMESNSRFHTGQPKNLIIFLRALSKCFLNTDRFRTMTTSLIRINNFDNRLLKCCSHLGMVCFFFVWV